MGASGFSSFNSESPLTGNLSAAPGAGVSSVVAFTRVVRKHFAHTELVEICAAGALGTVASSERFKKDIAIMGQASEAILSLRPVTFH
jgi:hypothetical protein